MKPEDQLPRKEIALMVPTLSQFSPTQSMTDLHIRLKYYFTYMWICLLRSLWDSALLPHRNSRRIDRYFWWQRGECAACRETVDRIRGLSNGHPWWSATRSVQHIKDGSECSTSGERGLILGNWQVTIRNRRFYSNNEEKMTYINPCQGGTKVSKC
jgi:hypothetical protein